MLMKIMKYLARKKMKAVKFFTFSGYYYGKVLSGNLVTDFWKGRILRYKEKDYYLYDKEINFNEEYNWKTKLYGIEIKIENKDYLVKLNEEVIKIGNTNKFATDRQELLWSEITNSL